MRHVDQWLPDIPESVIISLGKKALRVFPDGEFNAGYTREICELAEAEWDKVKDVRWVQANAVGLAVHIEHLKTLIGDVA